MLYLQVFDFYSVIIIDKWKASWNTNILIFDEEGVQS